jgi:Transposase DDE domain
VIGMAVTRDGIPGRVWCWPRNTNDSALIRQVKDDMRDWTLSCIAWVADRGFTSVDNRRFLRQGDHHYIIGEKLRSGSAEADATLSRRGRYCDVTANLKVKEVRVSDSERFVICCNPEAAERDAKVRERMLAQLGELIKDSDRLTTTRRAELRGVISTKPGLNRYLRVTPGGLLRTDAAKIKAEENLDGKYLLPASDPKLSAEDIALGYKHCWKSSAAGDLKQAVYLRPVYHWKEERIRAHVILCWLALLLIRIAETTTSVTWAKITDELDLLTLGTFTGPPAPSDSPPSSPRPSATCSPSSRSSRRRRSSKPPRPQPPDQYEHHRLVTRSVTTPACIRAQVRSDHRSGHYPGLESEELRTQPLK